MENKRVSVQFYMSSNTRRKLRLMAVEQDMTINELLRETLEAGFKSKGLEIDMSEGLEERGGYRPRKDSKAEG